MRIMLGMLLLLVIMANPSEARGQSNCAPTVGNDLFGPSLPESDDWYGSEALAVQLPVDGVWPTTPAGALISVKLFWWSAGFRPGMESNLSVTVRNLGGGPVTAVVSRPTNAHDESLGGWTMLTGIDFPDPGCWEITGEYLGQTLTFVVETVANKSVANLPELLDRVREGPRDMLDRIRSQPPSDADCEISEELRAIEHGSAQEEATRSVALQDFRYLSFQGGSGPIVPGIVYAFESCSDTSSNLKLALPEDGSGGFCQERTALFRIALDFAGEYNSLIRQQREDRGIAVCTTI